MLEFDYLGTGFYLGHLGYDCVVGEILIENEGCRVAATQLTMEYKGKYKGNERPKGCYYWPVDNTIYFNDPNQSVARNIDSRTGGVCKRSM